MSDATARATSTGQKTTRRRRNAPRKGISLLAVVAILAGIALTAGPLYWMVVSSFKNRIEVVALEPTIVPREPTAENYANLVTGGLPFGNFFFNSVLTAVLTAVVATIICTLAGYSFSRGNYRLRGPLSMSVLVVQMLPFVVLVGPLYLLMSSYGLLNTYVGLILGYTTFALPFGTWMMKGFIDAIPREIEEAARVDGYRRLGILFRVVVPLCLPGLATTATMIFIESWNNLLYPLVLMSQTEKLTLPPGLLQSFSGEFQFDWGGMMAATTVTSIPLVAAFFAVQRYMVHGITAGALSGT